MTKVHTTITIDPELMKKAKELRLNISGEFQDFLEFKIASHGENVAGIDVRLEKIKLEKALKKKTYWDNEVQTMQSRLKKLEEEQRTKEESMLKEEKERIEAMKKCINCGSFLEEGKKSHKFNKGNVCGGCFSSCNSQDIERWNRV